MSDVARALRAAMAELATWPPLPAAWAAHPADVVALRRMLMALAFQPWEPPIYGSSRVPRGQTLSGDHEALWTALGLCYCCRGERWPMPPVDEMGPFRCCDRCIAAGCWPDAGRCLRFAAPKEKEEDQDGRDT